MVVMARELEEGSALGADFIGRSFILTGIIGVGKTTSISEFSSMLMNLGRRVIYLTAYEKNLFTEGQLLLIAEMVDYLIIDEAWYVLPSEVEASFYKKLIEKTNLVIVSQNLVNVPGLVAAQPYFDGHWDLAWGLERGRRLELISGGS